MYVAFVELFYGSILLRHIFRVGRHVHGLSSDAGIISSTFPVMWSMVLSISNYWGLTSKVSLATLCGLA